MKLNAIEQRAVLRELVRREAHQRAAEEGRQPTTRELLSAQQMLDEMFPEQRAFFTDPAKRRVGFCTRRAGKTTGAARYLLHVLLLNPGSLALYIAQTSQMARMYIWRELKKLVEQYELPFSFNETNLWMIHTRGGGMLVLKGADKADEIDKLRGPKWKLAILDESASFGAFVENLIIEVIGPALRDEGGHLLLLGTPGPHPSGLFYEASEGIRKDRNGKPIYTVHRWSLEQNPFLPPDAKDLDLICAEEGLTLEDPRFRREYLGLWTLNNETLMFRFDLKRNVYEGVPPPEHQWITLLGCDFGWEDESAIVCMAVSYTSPTVYILETWAKKHAYSDMVAREIRRFRDLYQPSRIVGDTGGYGKGTAVHLARDYQIHIEQAKKNEKLNHVEFMNSAFLRGDVKVKKGDPLCDEYLQLPWNEQKTDAHNHARDNRAMAALYVWRVANNYANKKKKKLAKPTDSNEIAQHEKLVALDHNNGKKEPWFLSGTAAVSIGSGHAPPFRGGMRGPGA
jgi:hypothetical protein